MPREYDFIKVEPAQPSILTNPRMIFQRKFDGVSSEVFVEDEISIIGRGVLKGRNSDLTEKFPELVKDIKALGLPRGTRFLPEIIVLNPQGFEELALIQTRVHRESSIEFHAKLNPANMIVHDVASIGQDLVGNMPYEHRLDAIRPLISKSHRLSVIQNFHIGTELWDSVIKKGLEGIVARDKTAPLGRGVYKLKREFTEDVFCIGGYKPSTSDTNSELEYVVDGQKKRGVFANLECFQIDSKGNHVTACDVGTGFSQDDRRLIQAMLDSCKITRSTPLVLEVKANARQESGRLRHPSFLRIRNDKPWNECIIKNPQ